MSLTRSSLIKLIYVSEYKTTVRPLGFPEILTLFKSEFINSNTLLVVEFRVKIRKHVWEDDLFGPTKEEQGPSRESVTYHRLRSVLFSLDRFFHFFRGLGLLVWGFFFYIINFVGFFLNIEVIDGHCRAFICKQKENKNSPVICTMITTVAHFGTHPFFLCICFVFYL